MNQDNLKGLKASAKVLGRELEALGHPKIPQSHLLEALARTTGFASWTALRAVATAPVAAVTPSVSEEVSTARYPKHYVAATYAAGPFIVELVKWEDPVVKLGYGFYAYDQASGRCLTPTAPYLFNTKEVPSYEDVQNLIDALEYLGECNTCHYVSEENEGITLGSKCHKPGCTGLVRPFLKMFD